MYRPALSALALLTFLSFIPQLDAQQVGPSNGSLVIVGGAMSDTGIMEHFLDLAGGPDAPIVVIPTAGGGDEYDQFYQGLNSWRDVGATHLTVLHTKDRAVTRTYVIQPLVPLHPDSHSCRGHPV